MLHSEVFVYIRSQLLNSCADCQLLGLLEQSQIGSRPNTKDTTSVFTSVYMHFDQYHFFYSLLSILQIQQVKSETGELKKVFKEHISREFANVNQLSEDTILNITVLDDMYIYGTHLAEKRSDRQLLDEYDEVSSKLRQTIDDDTLEKTLILKTPYLNKG